MSEHGPQEPDGKQSSTHYRWAVSSRGYVLTGRASTEIDPSDYFSCMCLWMQLRLRPIEMVFHSTHIILIFALSLIDRIV